MKRPDEAAHVLGKLLVHFGPERILWGTDAIWYGSPQDQLQAFRAFEIAPQLRERYGYPELSRSVAQIIGENATTALRTRTRGAVLLVLWEELARGGACASGSRSTCIVVA